MDEQEHQWVDISAETFGKYRNCTHCNDGLWYAEVDCVYTGRGKFKHEPKKGALPAPMQDTWDRAEHAYHLHQEAASRLLTSLMHPEPIRIKRMRVVVREFNWRVALRRFGDSALWGIVAATIGEMTGERFQAKDWPMVILGVGGSCAFLYLFIQYLRNSD